MKFGAVYPQVEYSLDPAAIKDYAQTLEGLGFNHLLAYDHVLGANPQRPGGWSGPYTYLHPFQEPLVLFGFMAGITTRLEFISGIIILPQRQTALFAKQAATLDVLSGGRTRIGVGIGWNQVEYSSLNENFHNRGMRIEEQVEVLRRLWTEELVTYSGRWHNIPDAGLNPLPRQRPIPLWFGGHAPAVLQRAARLGEGWLPTFRTPAEAKPALDSVQRALIEAGRSPDQFGIEVRLPYGDGNPETWHRQIEDWRSAGASHLDINTMGAGFSKPGEHLAALEKFSGLFTL